MQLLHNNLPWQSILNLHVYIQSVSHCYSFPFPILHLKSYRNYWGPSNLHGGPAGTDRGVENCPGRAEEARAGGAAAQSWSTECFLPQGAVWFTSGLVEIVTDTFLYNVSALSLGCDAKAISKRETLWYSVVISVSVWVWQYGGRKRWVKTFLPMNRIWHPAVNSCNDL